MKKPLWGIDLGGTKTEGIILPSLQEPNPIIRIRVDTESEKGYDHILQRITELVGKMSKQTGINPAVVGFGTPGVLDPLTRTMKNCNTTVLNGKPLQRDLEKLLGIPVILANDANCFALAETHWGTVKELLPSARMVFGIIMGTGVGGGIVFEGKPWNGKQGIAGEWGHNFLDESGGPCYCGKAGCVETVLSGPGLEKYYFGLTGKKKRLKEIVADAAQYASEADVKTLERLHYFFGKAVSVVINILDPDVIVVGGGVGNIESLYSGGKNFIKPFIFNNLVNTELLKPSLGDSAGVFGAAALSG